MVRLRREQAQDALAMLVLGLVPFIYFWPVTSLQQAFDGMDVSNFQLPIRYELERALAEGRLPLWTPMIGAGFPLFAEGHIAIFYPFILLFHLLLPLMPALSYSILFHFAWASLGMYLLVRASGLRATGAFLAAFVFGFNGFSLAHLPHLNLSAAAAWLPWLILLQVKYWQAEPGNRKAKGIWFLLISLAVAMQLFTGYAQIVALSMIVFGLSGLLAPVLWQPVPNRRSNPGSLVGALFRSTAITVLQVLAGAGLAAAQLLPTFELVEQSVREQIADSGFATSYSLNPVNLTQFVYPFGQLGIPSITNQEYWAYVGLVPLLLACILLLIRRDALILFLSLLAAGAVAFSLGDVNPAYALVIHLPLYNEFRVPARFLFLFTFTIAWLAGIALETVSQRFADSQPWRARSVWTLAAVAGIGSAVLGAWEPLEFWTGVWRYLPGVIVLLGGVVFLLAYKRAIGRSSFQAALTGLAIADLVLFANPFLSTIDSTSVPSALLEPPPAITAMSDDSSFYRLFTNVYNETLRPDHAIVYDKQSAQVYSPLALQRNEAYLNDLTPEMLNLANIRYYFLPSGPLPPGFEEPTASVVLDVLHAPVDIPSTRASEIEMVSFTDQSSDLPDGVQVGELTLSTAIGGTQVLPIRMGIETADWADAAVQPAEVKHRQPIGATPFPAYLISLGHSFEGFKYTSRYTLPSALDITAVHVHSDLPDGDLTVESMTFIAPDGSRSSLASLAHRSDFTVAFKSHAVTLLENRDVYPRAFMVHNAEVIPDERVLARLADQAFEPDRTVLLSEGQALAGDKGGDKDQVTVTDYESEHVTVNVSTQKAGYLILTDSWYPGWEARVDGARVPLYRADYVFRAVLIQRGEHQVQFEFHPTSLVLGGAISLLCLTGTCVVLLLNARRERR